MSEEYEEYTAGIDHLKNDLRPSIGLSEIDKLVDGMRGKVVVIPETSPEKEQILSKLMESIIGQDEACSKIADILDIGINRIMHDKGCFGSIFLAGPTGVGKTETLRVLANMLLGNPDAFTKIDCDQLQESHTARSLFGSPPSYVGGDITPSIHSDNVHRHFLVAEEMSRLHPIIANKKNFSILLFDEIEKAHPKVRQSLLSLVDDGKIKLANGDEVSYANTLIAFTSNVGEDKIADNRKKNSIGFMPQSNEVNKSDEKLIFDTALNEAFSKEWIGRIGLKVRYNSISKNQLDAIIKSRIEKYTTTLREYFIDWNVHIGLSGEAITFIANEGFNPEEGARPLMRAIDKYITTPANKILKANKDEDFLLRKNPTILYFNVSESGESLEAEIHTPDIIDEPKPEEMSNNPEMNIGETVISVADLLEQGQTLKEILLNIQEDDFAIDEIKILIGLDKDNILDLIFNNEFYSFALNQYDDADLFGRFRPKVINTLIQKKAENLFNAKDYPKDIFIIKIIVQSILSVIKLMNLEELTPEQETIIARFAVNSALELY